MNKSSYLLYETDSAFDWWIRLIFVGLPVITFAIGLVMLMQNSPDAPYLFSITVFYILLFYWVMPRKLQVYEDRLRILLGKPFSFSISFGTIKSVRHASAGKAYVYWGVRWATSSHNVVEIERSKGLSMVISPTNSDTFVTRVNDALKNYRSAK
jgi:hypothetical protein